MYYVHIPMGQWTRSTRWCVYFAHTLMGQHTVVWRSLAAVAVAAAAGLASGLMGNVSGVVYANMFGRRHLGTIVGVSKVRGRVMPWQRCSTAALTPRG